MTSLTPKKKAVFLEELRDNANVSASAKVIRVSRECLYQARRVDPDFAADWDEAVDVGTDALEDEAVRRGSEGTIRPVFYKGEECGGIREYSDTLLIFMLKARRPEKFRERLDLTQSDDPLRKLTVADLDAKIVDLLRKTAVGGTADGETETGGTG